MTTAISVTGLEKSYGRLLGAKRKALGGLTLDIPTGSAFGLVGPNGAGKTTFIKLLLGVVRPDRGSVTVLGSSPDDASMRRRIGYLPERLHLPPSRTARDIVTSTARLKGVPLTAEGREALLEKVGLREAAGRRSGGFSKGMKQRLGLALAFLGEPDLLILDEPTDGIDPIGRSEMRRLLLAERTRGATILLNSHLLAETERLCDRVGIVHQGRLLANDTLDALRSGGAEGWTARWSPGAAPPEPATLGFTPAPAPGEWRFVGTADALNTALEAARTRGALLLELRPDRRDLEAVLETLVRESDAERTSMKTRESDRERTSMENERDTELTP